MQHTDVRLTAPKGRYVILDKLGEGGMGEVFRAYDRLTDRKVALKRLWAKDPQGVVAFAQEFRVLSGLRHPFIVDVIDYGLDESGQPFFTMQLLENAQPLLEFAKTVSRAQQIMLLLQIFQALVYLHRLGIIHRDIKPANILVVDGKIKLLDFGLMVQKRDILNIDLTSGTLAYMAPETLNGQMPTPATDLYSVGIVAYEMFAGAHPFLESSLHGLLFNILNKPIELEGLDLSPEAMAVMEMLLAKDPEHRYQSADDALLDLCVSEGLPLPEENALIRESFLQRAEFVGRECELARFKAALAAAQAGQGSGLLVGGESGVGKTRLLDEMRTLALVQGVMVLSGQVTALSSKPYELWRTVTRRLLLDVDVSDGEAGIIKEIVPDIDRLLKRPVVKPPQLQDQAHKERLTATIRSLFLKAGKPIALFLEDLQWATDSLIPLKHLLQFIGEMPLLIVANYRYEERPELPAELPQMQPMLLNRLGTEEITALTVSMLGEIGKHPELASLIARETEGNTFFIVEVVRSLAEDAGSLDQIRVRNLPTSIFPQGMQALIHRRLHRVPEKYQPLLQQAAIGGKLVDPAIIERLAPATIDTRTWLHDCSHVAVLELRDGQWQFAHDKLREVAVAELSREELAHLHQRMAEAIEALYPNRSSYNEQLLEHWHHAGNLNREIAYLAPVASRLINLTGEYRRAAQMLERGMQQLPVDDARRIPLLLYETASFKAVGNYERAQASAKATLQQAQQQDNPHGIAESLDLLGSIAYLKSDYVSAAAFFWQSMEIWQGLEDRAGIAQVYYDLSTVAMSKGEYDQARGYCEQSLTIYQALNDLRNVARSRKILAAVAMHQGKLDEASVHYHEGVAVGREIGDQNGTATSLHGLALVARKQGDYEQALSYYQQTLEILRTLGSQRNIALTLNNLGILSLAQGYPEQALEYLFQSLQIKQALGDQSGVAYCYINLGRAKQALGDFAQGQDYLARSLAMLQKIGDQVGIACSYMHWGFLQLEMGNCSAQASFLEGLKIAQTLHSMPILLETLVGLAHCYLQQSDATRAAQLAGFVEHASTTYIDVRQRLQVLIPLLAQALSPDIRQAALSGGKVLEMEQFGHGLWTYAINNC